MADAIPLSVPLAQMSDIYVAIIMFNAGGKNIQKGIYISFSACNCICGLCKKDAETNLGS